MVQVIGRQFKLLRDGISAGTLNTFILIGRNDTYCVTEHQETKEIVSKYILVGILVEGLFLVCELVEGLSCQGFNLLKVKSQ